MIRIVAGLALVVGSLWFMVTHNDWLAVQESKSTPTDDETPLGILLYLLFGGIGKRRGRRDPEKLRVGDVLDWWRVEDYVPDQRLRLSAEMKVPGRAWLEFDVEQTAKGTSIRQTAIFDPVGLFGLAYWYSLYPIHGLIFSRMIDAIAEQATENSEASLSIG